MTSAFTNPEPRKEILCRHMEQFFEATADGIVFLDRSYRFIFLNRRARKILAPHGDLLSKSLLDSFPDSYYEGSPCVETYRRTMEQGISGEFETFYPSPLNSWLRVQSYPAEEGIIIFFRDLTEEKLLQEALHQSEKLAVVGRLARSIAHEINNPLESVTNLLYLARNTNDHRDIQQYLQTAEIELRRVSAITRQALRFHKQTTNPHAVDAKDLLENALSICQGKMENHNVQVLERTRALRPIRCLDSEITQVLCNFINNSLDAMRITGGLLYLRTRDATNWRSGEKGIALTVADTGAGMSAETFARLFDPFFTTKGVTNTGLGLWISKEIADRHSGTIRIRSSRSPAHRGTVVTLFLPFNAVVR